MNRSQEQLGMAIIDHHPRSERGGGDGRHGRGNVIGDASSNRLRLRRFSASLNIPYTVGLQRSIPKLGDVKKRRLSSIKGVVPDPFASLQGCPYHPRCPEAMPGVCDEGMAPALVEIELEHQVACFLYHEERVGTA